MNGNFDPNTMGLLIYLLSKDKRESDESCYNMTSYEKEMNGCKCTEYNVCAKIEKVEKWPRLVDMLTYIRSSFLRLCLRRAEE